MRTRIIPLLLGCFLIGSHIQAQAPERCGTVAMQDRLRVLYPEMETTAEFEEWMARKMEDALPTQRNVITLPVVVHVVHAGEPLGFTPNITDAQVISQINVLNQDFRRMAGTPGYNTHPDGADMEIQFELAQIDPQGNPTNGINRTNQNKPLWTMDEVDEDLKPNTIWDPERYLNIWSCRLEAGVLGFAQFPVGSGLDGINGDPTAETDGVVIGAKYFGTIDEDDGTFFLDGTYNMGRTLTHEMGHFLGLRHIWGDGGCAQDDFCTDTPDSDTSNTGCDVGHVSCGTADMIENYMDYTVDACMNIFTNDQKGRMHTVLANSPRRVELVTSTVPTQQPVLETLGFSLSPNPCDGQTTLRLDSNQSASVRIYNMAGQQVGSASANNGEARLDLRHLPKGVYLVKTFSEMGDAVGKVVVY